MKTQQAEIHVDQGVNVSLETIEQELQESFGLFPEDFEPEEWLRLVEYYQNILEQVGNIEELMLGFDIQTAAGRLAASEGDSVDPLQLGLNPIFLNAPVISEDSQESVLADGRRFGREERPEERDDTLIEVGESQEIDVVEPEPDPVDVFGSAGNDSIDGQRAPETIRAYGGDDTIFGAGGADTFIMGHELDSGDVLDGGVGEDVLTYTDANGNRTDELDNVTGFERIELGFADTRITTVDGLVADGATLEVDGSELNNRSMNFDGRAETDGAFDVTSADGRDTLRGGAENDVFRAGGNRDVVYGHGGDDSIFGGSGNDTLHGNEGADSLSGESGSDRLFGGDGDDTLLGGGSGDRLYGGSGADSLVGGAGNDRLWGDDGNDRLFGDDGNDTLYGGDGADFLNGGAGRDVVYGQGGDDILTGGAGADKLYGGADDDSLSGGADNDQLRGEAGDDTLRGESGNDKLWGGGGDDSLFGGAGRDTLQGNDGDDSLYGGADNDNLRGHDGDDLFHGGAGADRMRGDAGADTFLYESLDEGGDRIDGFVSGQDSFRFDGIDFDKNAGFISGNYRGYDGSEAAIGSNGATFVFDERNGNFWYDENGDEAGGHTLIADVNGQDVEAIDINIV